MCLFNKLYRVPMDVSGNAGKPVDIWMDKPVKGPDGMRAANGRDRTRRRYALVR
jgi:hypothetical protein